MAVERRRRVGIVDDTKTIRLLLRAVLEADPRLEVVGEAGDPYEAREMIKATNPDVITLDVEMPRMNGLVFLEHLMRLRPMPVVMVSTRTQEKSEAAIKAMSIGAVDCVDVARLQGDASQRKRLAETLYHAAGARVIQRGGPDPRAARPQSGTDFSWNGKFVAIGSSTGGVDALERVFAAYPANCPPTLVAQHMPPAFLRSFAARLDSTVAPTVRLAEDGMPINQGEILIAAGGLRHIAFGDRRGRCVASPNATGEELYVPSVDVLFSSALPLAHDCIGVILTGMGRDGAETLLALRNAGAHTIVQSGETCVIDGMPRAARSAGAAERVLPLDRIGQAIVAATNGTIRDRAHG